MRPALPKRLAWSATRQDYVFLVGIVSVAVLLRVAASLLQGNTVTVLPGIYDQLSYDALARRVNAGFGFSFATDWWPLTRADAPTAHWSYLYTLFLTGVYSLFGPHPLAARLIQAVVAGVLHPWLAWRVGRRVFGPQVGMAAAGLTAIYAYFVYYASALMTETFYILAILWTLDLAMTIAHKPNVEVGAPGRRLHILSRALQPWLLLGVALALAALLRQVILLFVPFLFAWLVWNWRRVGSGPSHVWAAVGGCLVSLAVVAACIAPWTIRNYQVFQRFVLLNTNAGYALFWANHPIYGADFVPILNDVSYQSLIPADLRGLDEAALDQALLREGLRFMFEDPARYARLSLSRIGDYFMFWPSAESGLISNLSRVLSFGAMLPFMVYGLILSLIQRRRLIMNGQWSAIWVLYLFVGVYSLIHLLTWSLIRYRLPVDAILLLFAGLAVTDVVARIKLMRWAVQSPGASQEL